MPLESRFPDFADRHIGPTDSEQAKMLAECGYESLDVLIDAALPAGIRIRGALNLPSPVSEAEATAELRAMAALNQPMAQMIGLAYHDTITPPVIRRNVLENPAWYTVAKRLVDYGFHAPTMSFPVAGTLMVEPTESEDLREIDRFCDAMIAIRAEIEDVARGRWPLEGSPLRNAPHTAESLIAGWDLPYDRELAVYPPGVSPAGKYWPAVRRVDGTHGDRNLVCSCPPLDAHGS